MARIGSQRHKKKILYYLREGVSSVEAFESIDFYEDLYERDASESYVNIMSDTQNCEAAEMSRPLPVRGGEDGESGSPEGGPEPDNVA